MANEIKRKRKKKEKKRKRKKERKGDSYWLGRQKDSLFTNKIFKQNEKYYNLN